MKHPDGMANRHQEQKRMKEANNTLDPTHDIVAVREDGTVLYITESCFSEKEAEQACEKANRLHGTDRCNAWDIVDHFEIRERPWDYSNLPREYLR